MKNDRVAQVLIDGNWVNIEFSQLKAGDRFKIFESDGEEIKDFATGNTEFVAESDAFLNKDDVWTIDIED